MVEFIQHPVVQALAWALVHFVWQGAAIGLVSYAAFRLLRTSASARYAIGVGALVATLIAPAATFVILANEPAAPAQAGASMTGDLGLVIPAGPGTVLDVDLGAPAPRLRVEPDWLALAVLTWLGGVAFFSLRLVGGWIVARRFARRAVQPASDQIQTLARQLANRLAVRRAVAILQSGAVAVPVMLGWLKPTIVLPLAALSGLNPAQVEALLAHELAHVRRHDYLVNLLQSVAEALLFYHPAVWWLSRRVRAERELCCDDLAIGVCDRLVYATALTDLAAMASPRLALGATDGDLLSRVRRILGHHDDAPAVRDGVMPVLALALVAGIAVPAALASAIQAPAALSLDAQGIPAQASATAGVHPEDRAGARLEPGDSRELMAEPVGGLQQTASQTPPQTAQQQTERQKQIEEARRKLEEAQKELAQLQAKRAEELRLQASDQYQQTLDQNRKTLEQSQAARGAEIAAARRQFEDARKKFDAGLISESQLMEARAALAKAEAKGDATATIAAALDEARVKLDRSHVLIERGLMSPTQTAELEVTIKALAQRMADMTIDQKALAQAMESAQAAREKSLTDARQRSDLLAARLDGLDEKRLVESLQALRAGIDKTVTGSLPSLALQHVDPSSPVQAGDVLRMTINGEPDLPASYRVTGDGTIRLPFVGAIKVAGLNTAQVREAVGKQLSAKKLGSVDQVTVAVTRPGTIKNKTAGPEIIKQGSRPRERQNPTSVF